ncbi:peptidase S51 dipeptidase E [Niallia circulans]|uniref:Peptidase S51 dipeptidase E n=1 Tax=Niallia circulans TaxID=1397 RepID=A0A553SN88_NIACI|nr:Type 1 glutamine amidotransferase-like domain-containing protein [Niallia circulans]TRZ38461.1 peptidase S51 dipeptidase E [Niallia circulans]
MARHFYAFGSGPPFTSTLAQQFMEQTKRGAIAILLVDRDDWLSYMPAYTDELKKYGAGTFYYLPLPSTTEEQVIKTIKDSGGIIICGGDTSRYAEYIADTNIGAAIKEAYVQGVPVAGFSAGALISPQKCIISSKDNKEQRYAERNGIGLLYDTYFAVHFSEWNETSHLQAIKAKHPTANVYGIDEKTGVYFQNEIIARMEGGGVYQIQTNGCKKIVGT